MNSGTYERRRYALHKGHPPVCRWHERTPCGYVWQDMPGNDMEMKRASFALYRRGLMPEPKTSLGRTAVTNWRCRLCHERGHNASNCPVRSMDRRDAA